MAAGVNLPILLEALSLREHMPLKQLLNQLKKMSRGMLPNMQRAIGRIQSVQSGREDEL